MVISGDSVFNRKGLDQILDTVKAANDASRTVPIPVAEGG
ncbi:unnamed protein product [Scytosiphon promiscuus]